MLRFIKNCDDLNFESFIKNYFFEYFGYSNKYIGFDIGGDSVTVNDILTEINIYSGDNSFPSGITLLRYITVDIQMFLDMLQLLKGDILILVKLWRFILINLVKGCCLIWIS